VRTTEPFLDLSALCLTKFSLIKDKAELITPHHFSSDITNDTHLINNHLRTMALEAAPRVAIRGSILSKTISSSINPPYATRPLLRASTVALRAQQQRRRFHASPRTSAPNIGMLGINSNSNVPSTYFQRPSLPANTIIRFVPQQTAWIVERMGKFNRILEPGLSVLIPFLDRIAYVKSLKEAAIEIPSQSAITADNVTLELDGILYTRVFDAYKAR